MKKKILAALTCMALVLSMTACAKEEGPNYISSNDRSSKSSVTESGNTPDDPENSGSGSSADPGTSSTPESKPEESKPEEPSAPAGSGIDWDSVPYADELDFICEDYDSFKLNIRIGDNFKARYAGGVVITKYTGSEKLIKIPETIDGKPVVGLHGNDIYDGIFSHLSDISVKIPKNLGIIRWCFSSCDNLTVDIPGYEAGNDGTYRMLYDASFILCNNLKLNMEPNSVGAFYFLDSMLRGAFCSCTFNGVLVMPDSLIYVAPTTFSEAYSGGVNFNGVSHIVYKGKTYDLEHFGAFIDKVNYDESGMKIENGVLKKVSRATEGTFTVPDNITSIGKEAFFECLDITEVIIPDSVTNIHNEAFGFIHNGQIGGGFKANVTYKGKTYKYNQLENLIKAVNGN